MKILKTKKTSNGRLVVLGERESGWGIQYIVGVTRVGDEINFYELAGKSYCKTMREAEEAMPEYVEKAEKGYVFG